jgi:DNA-binding response OmpR family regulator
MDTLLVIEDSQPMQRAIQRVFEAEAFTVQLASDGLAGLEAFRANTPSAVVLDLKLPGMTGRDLCREFKAIAPSLPIIVVSANAEVDDKVLLLELGADDYVTKPFSPKELVARVRRAMRRALQMSVSAAQVSQAGVPLYRFADVTVDVASMEVRRSGQSVSLTAQEFRVLRYFIDRANRAISREELLNEVWGYQNYPSTRTVDNHILRLRQKLEVDPSNPQHFLTLHRAGYKFAPTAGQGQAGG